MGDKKSPQFVGLFSFPFQNGPKRPLKGSTTYYLLTGAPLFVVCLKKMPGGGILVETHSGYPPFQALHIHSFFSRGAEKTSKSSTHIASENQMWSKLLVSSHHSCFETLRCYLILPYNFGRIRRQKRQDTVFRLNFESSPGSILFHPSFTSHMKKAPILSRLVLSRHSVPDANVGDLGRNKVNLHQLPQISTELAPPPEN